MNKYLMISFIMFPISIGSAVYVLLNLDNIDQIIYGFVGIIISSIIGFIATQKAKEYQLKDKLDDRREEEQK